MANYFSVPHLGAGSSEVESLGCYFFRLARAHGCTQWQLASHVAVWWDNSQGQGAKSRFPKAAAGANTMAVSGYGQDVEKLVRAVAQGTGIGTLRSGTLLALQSVAARSSIGTLRNSRAWCPACYEEDIQAGHETYDRLLWAIAPIKRCAVHKISLMSRCPTCDSAQFYSVRCTQLDLCNSCGSSLPGQVEQRAIVEHPTLGENLIQDLLAACAINPELTLNRQGMRAFFKRSRCELPKGDPLLGMSSLRGTGMRPTLETILRMATAFGVSLLDFQTDQSPSTNRSLYPPKSPAITSRPYRRLPPEVRDRVALEKVLENPQMPPPFGVFCQKLLVSTGYVAYQFPALARIYAIRRNEILHADKMTKTTAAHAAIDAGLMEDFRSGRILHKKQLISAVADASGVSVNAARKAVALCQMPATTLQRRKFPSR